MDIKNILNEINISNSDLHCELSDIKNNVAVIRCNLKTRIDTAIIFDLFKEKSGTKWIVQGKLNNPEKVVYHKYWLCKHSKRNKVIRPNIKGLTSRNTFCKSKINILIKKNNRYTRKNDLYLKKNPPLCGKVTLMFKHNHVINTNDSLEYHPTLNNDSKDFKDSLNLTDFPIINNANETERNTTVTKDLKINFPD